MWISKKELVDRVLYLMSKHRIQKVELGEKLGSAGSKQAKSKKAARFLNEDTGVDVGDIERVADLLGTSPQWLLFGDQSNKVSGTANISINQQISGKVDPLEVAKIAHGLSPEDREALKQML